jgi:DNA-binding transcriptional regulator YiaG
MKIVVAENKLSIRIVMKSLSDLFGMHVGARPQPPKVDFLLFLGESSSLTLIGSPTTGSFRLPKSIYTDRHKRLCELLKAQRKAAGLTQTVLAERLGKPPSYVAKYELGERRLDLLEYMDVAAAIGFDPCKVVRALKPTR